VDRILEESTDYDILFIPGGDSALEAAKDEVLIQWVRNTTANVDCVMAVCTGTILLGITDFWMGGVLTNKLDFTATVPLAPKVNREKQARWLMESSTLLRVPLQV